jgi:hypothetical protein
MPEANEQRMRQSLMSCVRDALDRPWLLDLYAAAKPKEQLRRRCKRRWRG